MKKTIVIALAVVLASFSLTFWIISNDASSIGDSFEAQPIDVAVGALQIGAVIQFGGYEWRVLDVQNNRALIITENIIEIRPYNEQSANVTWETSSLRRYLNGEFLQKFTGEDQRRIAETRIVNNDNLWYGTNGGSNTIDKVFLLSLEEVDRYFGNSGDYENRRRKSGRIRDDGTIEIFSDDNGVAFSNANDSDRIARYNDNPWLWWLRSPGLDSYFAAIVYNDGDVLVDGGGANSGNGGVRPALWLNL